MRQLDNRQLLMRQHPVTQRPPSFLLQWPSRSFFLFVRGWRGDVLEKGIAVAQTKCTAVNIFMAKEESKLLSVVINSMPQMPSMECMSSLKSVNAVALFCLSIPMRQPEV